MTLASLDPPISDETQATPALQNQFQMLEERFAELKAQVRQAQQLSAMGLATATIAHEFSNLLPPVAPDPEAPRPDEVYFDRQPPKELMIDLAKRGHKLSKRRRTGIVQAIQILEDGTLVFE